VSFHEHAGATHAHGGKTGKKECGPPMGMVAAT
jgi:hypothetical protein